ncbi:hypothetical protein LshimejAT787_0407080 [Lyophyllum shimeji]|uniref:Uncharacterized protein n=1 Tax=Lyophyllum shimeji TaxID=47721 RepID=A0A9P3PK16_LYOSH|nr:hypothetical protein LshimejAT787_0407080 [Lyophyllum shimeji]
MSHSTTATTTYALAKYSKSYPSGPQPNPEFNTAEWQHFTNPSIRLVLDIKKGADLESVRLRIVWSMDPSNTPDQREVVFEDIDLLTLSCLPHRPAQKQQAHGLPLKAVYRDTVVGIRYLHPIDTTKPPTYRRFQITFLSAVSVLEFINAISTICPCKANPSTNGVLRPMNPPSAPIVMPNSQHHHGSIAHIPANCPPPAPPATMVQQPRHPLQASFSSSPSLAFQSSVQPTVYSSSPLRVETSDFRIPSSSTALPALEQPGVNAPTTDHLAQSMTYSKQFSQPPTNTRVQDLQQQTSLPSSSPPASSARSAHHNGLTTPTSTASGELPADQASAIVASLRESTSLYDLPRAALEQLIAEVVREEGFPKLLEDISSMWRVKSFVGI